MIKIIKITNKKVLTFGNGKYLMSETFFFHRYEQGLSRSYRCPLALWCDTVPLFTRGTVTQM